MGFKNHGPYLFEYWDRLVVYIDDSNILSIRSLHVVADARVQRIWFPLPDHRRGT